MINQQFMQSLAKLESVACSQAEKDTINEVRGRYVNKFGSDDQFVQSLAMLESVAATQSERNEINTIRGKYGLFNLTNRRSQAHAL